MLLPLSLTHLHDDYTVPGILLDVLPGTAVLFYRYSYIFHISIVWYHICTHTSMYVCCDSWFVFLHFVGPLDHVSRLNRVHE